MQTIVDELDSYQENKAAVRATRKDDDSRGGIPDATPEQEQPQSETPQEPAHTTDASDGKAEADGKQGRLILDATFADQAIRYPTDLSLLNEARQFCEQIID